MLDRVRPVWYLEEGFRLMLMVQKANTPLTLLRLAFTEFDTSTVEDRLWILSLERQHALCTGMAGRIKSRCLGLLEVVDVSTSDVKDRRVQFLHKTVADFLATPDMKRRMRACSGNTGMFLPEIAIMRGIAFELETVQTRMTSKEQFGADGKMTRGAWLSEVRARYDEATHYARTVAEDHPEYIDESNAIMTKMNKTVSEFWKHVSEKSYSERNGVKHWSEVRPGR
jgi:hypothetical protein